MNRLALAAFVLMGVAACSGDDDDTGAATTTTVPTSVDDGAAGTTTTTAPGEPAPSLTTIAGPACDIGDGQRWPDIVAVEVEPAGPGRWDFTVTVSSPYDSPERYADGWRIVSDGGEVLAEHRLSHDHAGEQPFTRTRGPVEVPPDVAFVTVEGHDQCFGFGGGTVRATFD